MYRPLKVISKKSSKSKMFFPNIEIHNVTNKIKSKGKPKFSITTKDPSRKQIIISISMNNSEKIILQANEHILNINRLLKCIKSNVSANYVCSNNKEFIIITNKVAAISDLNIIEKYVKGLNKIDLNDIMSP